MVNVMANLTLAQYLIAFLGDLNSMLNYTEADLAIVIEDSLNDYGVSSESEVTDIRVLRKLGKVHLWTKILTDASKDFNFSADGASYSSSQFYDMALKNYQIALSDAYAYLPGYEITTGEMVSEA
jgi:hypothetical protein